MLKKFKAPNLRENSEAMLHYGPVRRGFNSLFRRGGGDGVLFSDSYYWNRTVSAHNKPASVWHFCGKIPKIGA